MTNIHNADSDAEPIGPLELYSEGISTLKKKQLPYIQYAFDKGLFTVAAKDVIKQYMALLRMMIVMVGTTMIMMMMAMVIIIIIAIVTARIILHLISYPQFTYDLFHIHHSPSYLSREHMNPKLTCSQRQWLHSSVGRASHRYREVTGSSPVEVLNFFQASLRNCKNCDRNCEDHSSFDFISAVHI